MLSLYKMSPSRQVSCCECFQCLCPNGWERGSCLSPSNGVSRLSRRFRDGVGHPCNADPNGPRPTEPTSPQPSSISISSLQPHQHQGRHATCKARVSRFEISGTSHSKLSALCPCGRFRRGPVPDHWASMVATTMSACPGYGKEGSQHRTQRGRKSREYNRTWLGPSMGGCNAGHKSVKIFAVSRIGSLGT